LLFGIFNSGYTSTMIPLRKFLDFILPWFAMALLMNVTRFFMTDIHSYVYMNWNLFLATIPLIVIIFFHRIKNMYARIGLFFVWLFFLPNAPYMITDLIHLRDVGPDWMLWFDGMMIFSYAFMGIFITAYVLGLMKNELFTERGRQNIFLLIVSFLSSFGIYLGRYIRLNSWDIVLNPIHLATQIFTILKEEYFNPQFIFTLIFFTLIMLVSEYSMRTFFSSQK
jgi:uncharacterized membrane protein